MKSHSLSPFFVLWFFPVRRCGMVFRGCTPLGKKCHPTLSDKRPTGSSTPVQWADQARETANGLGSEATFRLVVSHLF